MNVKKLRCFMRKFMDPRNFATYLLTEEGKVPRPARSKLQIINAKNKQNNFISPKKFEFEQHLNSNNFRLGYFNRNNNNVWLLMLDFDTDKTSETRHGDLKAAVKLARAKLQHRFVVETATFSDDLHGYIKIQIPEGHNRRFIRRIICEAVQYLSNLCPIKKLEIMGFPAKYIFNTAKEITSIEYSGTIAKMPRSVNLRRLENQPVIPFETIVKLAAALTGTSKAGVPKAEPQHPVDLTGEDQQEPKSASVGVVETRILGETSFSPNFECIVTPDQLADRCTQDFGQLWNLMCAEESKLYSAKNRITKTEFIKLCDAWRSVVLTGDKEVPDRADHLRGTAATAEVSRRAQISCVRKRKWVEQTLVRLGVLMLRNGETEEGISRRWAWSWNALREALKQSSIPWVDKVPEKPNRWKSSKEVL